MAIELKEKEKNLLIQYFEYGETIGRDEEIKSSAYTLPGSNQVSNRRVNLNSVQNIDVDQDENLAAQRVCDSQRREDNPLGHPKVPYERQAILLLFLHSFLRRQPPN